MKSLVLALLIALLTAGTAHAQSVVTTDPVDTPASPYDIEALRVGYDAGPGKLEVTWRFAQPLPASAPAASDSFFRAEVRQGHDWSTPCLYGTGAGDVSVQVGHGGAPVDGVWPYRATYDVAGRDGFFEAPVVISPDRREVSVTVVDTAAAGRSFFCARASSSAGSSVVSDRRTDTVPAVFFPGYAPTPARLLQPNAGLYRGTTPALEWEASTLFTSEEVEISGPSMSTTLYPGASDTHQAEGLALAGTFTRPGATVRYAFDAPLPDGVYTWTVVRSFGALDAQRADGRFEIGPPDLARLVLTPKVKQPPRATKSGRAQLTVDATRGASAMLTVKRGSRAVRTSRFTIAADEDGKVRPVTVSVALPCRTPGRYTATVVASDRYGRQLEVSRSWTVGKARCAKLERAEARKHAAQRRRSGRRRTQTPNRSCMSGYSPCLPVTSDLDCDEIPESKKPVTVTGSDPYRLDADDDGTGCE